MKQYLELLDKILTEGVEKESGRLNMPNTIGISNAIIRMDLSEGFPLLTTKKMFLRGIITELLWFLRGDTNIKYLVDNNVNIWTPDAYRWYLKKLKDTKSPPWKDYSEPLLDTQEKFIEAIKNINTSKFPTGTYFINGETHYDDFKTPVDPALKEQLEWLLPLYNNGFGNGGSLFREGYVLGDLGKVYGHQWRNQNGVDQVKDVIEGLRDNPYSRYHIIDGWNKADFKDMALPPCHLLYQFIVRPLSQSERIDFAIKNGCEEEYYSKIPIHYDDCKIWLDNKNIPKFYLDLNMYQRSCDSACGIPFNLASMSLLLEIFSKASNMIPGVTTWIGGDTHLYIPHIETAKEQIKRTPYKLPTIKILKDIKTLDDILALTVNDFELKDYQSHGKLEYELFVGLKANPKKV
jgi:thymidylate synthase